MDSYRLFGFVCILQESLKVLSKSRKPMFYIASLTLILNSIFFLFNSFSIRPLISDFLFKSTILSITTPTSSDIAHLLIGIKDDKEIFLGTQSIFFLGYFIVSLFSIASTILVSFTTFHENNLSFKDLVLRVGKSWLRPFITSFHTTLYGVGFFFFVLIILTPVLAVRPPPTSRAIMTVLCVLFFIFWLYLSVVWVLATVVSVMEENCYGIEAFGKAGGIVKGNRLNGIGLNFFFTVLALIEIIGFRMIGLEKSPTVCTIVGLFMTNFTCLMSIFQYICFTVLYIQCKESHGEEIELQGNIEYSKMPNTLLV